MPSWIQPIALTTLTLSLLSGCHSMMNKTIPNEKIVVMHAVSSQGVETRLGTVRLTDSAEGLVITPELVGLPAGQRGFHIHEKPSCKPAEKDGVMVAALAAGSHYNPHQIPNHGSPLTGHLGDLPALTVDAKGMANTPVIAPRLKLADVKDRALMIHAGGDNYADHPQALGGGGSRIACGII